MKTQSRIKQKICHFKINALNLRSFSSLKFESEISIVAFFVTLARIIQFTFPSIEDQSLCSNDVRNILWPLQHQSKKQTICCYTRGNEMAHTLRKLNFFFYVGEFQGGFCFSIHNLKRNVFTSYIQMCLCNWRLLEVHYSISQNLTPITLGNEDNTLLLYSALQYTWVLLHL